MESFLNMPLHTTLCWTMIVTGAFTLFGLSKYVTAPYGRHSKAGWGILLDPKLSWFLMESPNLVMILFFYLKNYGMSGQLPPATNCILLVFYGGHYINRSLIFPMRIRNGKKMPITVMLAAAFYCSWNGYIQSKTLLELEQYGDEVLSSTRFILGSVVFISGFAINYHSDEVLRNLRKPGETGYKIPYGGAFKYVSCGNFFGEIVEWIGFAIASGSLSGAAFAFYTFANTAPRGASHHAWYLEKFKGEYEDLGRSAVIPFIW
ncbi:hypothetical protein TrLO_g3083 [Triparma laevis f. longispina]|uniref:3-oxo-5-alpha-steroid 4-dehydrogenase 1 n=1 Tax=Triparma laevis f. longispina TaxID=1714387 RepID=A0A9W7CF61_9STRA|nr:hypothetical protein TrLO_g3083 [Triparma laevis f. longispina]